VLKFNVLQTVRFHPGYTNESNYAVINAGVIVTAVAFATR